MTRLGLIVEGKTDWVILRALIQNLCPDGEVTLIHPKQDALDAGRDTGWSAIQRWLKHKGRQVEQRLSWGGYAGVALHLDGDVAGGRPCNPDAQAQWEAVNEKALQWSGIAAWPDGLIRAFSLQNLEAWICAALPGCKTRNPALECVADPLTQLPGRYKEAARNRDMDVYRDDFAPQAAQEWVRVRECCPIGAGRFEQDLKQCL